MNRREALRWIAIAPMAAIARQSWHDGQEHDREERARLHRRQVQTRATLRAAAKRIMALEEETNRMRFDILALQIELEEREEPYRMPQPGPELPDEATPA